MSSVIDCDGGVLDAGHDSWQAPHVPQRKPKKEPVLKRFTGTFPHPTSEELFTFASRLKFARLARGLGSNDLGRLAGAGIGEVSRVESGQRGKRPASATITKFANALEIDRAWLEDGRSSDGRIFLEQPHDDADLREQVAALKLQVGAILTAADIPDPVPMPLKTRQVRHIKSVPPKR